LGTAGTANEGFVDNKVNALVGLFPVLLYLIIFKIKENLDNNYCCKNIKKNNHFSVSLTHNYGIFHYTTLFTLYKSPEKKWHRSVKMDKNKCPFFKRVDGVCAKGPLKNTL
jgi:hypothetical protein